METIITIILTWITLMTFLLRKMPKSQMKAIGDFFKSVLPKIPIVGIIEAFRSKKP